MNPEALPLRDVHLPEPVGWWPPAPGWWLLLATMLALAAAAWWYRRRRAERSHAIDIVARSELQRLRDAWREHRDAERLTRDVSSWLRRVGMSVSSRRQAAALTGTDWLQYLDRLAGETVFADGPGRLIVEAPYRPAAKIDGPELVSLCERWLDRVAGHTRGRAA